MPGSDSASAPLGGTTLRRRLSTFTVIVPTALVPAAGGRPFVISCLESLLPAASRARSTTNGAKLTEIVLVTQGRTLEDPVIDALETAGVHVRQHDVLGPFNFSKKINAGAAAATGDVLFLLNDDARLTSQDWPEVVAGILEDERVGAVGPVILNPDGTLNSAGDALSRRGPRHVNGFDLRYRPGLAESLVADREVSLITGAACAIPRATFDSIGGFDDRYPASYGDVEFCLRLGGAGKRLVCTPRVSVVHRESSSRDPRVDPAMMRLLLAGHPGILREDPLLPPLAFPAWLRFTRSVGSVVRSIYRPTFRRLIPMSVRERVSDVINTHGWIP
jgi:O-antigen biosynthesis protein